MGKHIKNFFNFGLILSIIACSRFALPTDHDSYKELSRKDYETLLDPIESQKKKKKKVKSLEKEQVHSNFFKKISLNVSEEVPIKDILMMLAKDAGVDLEFSEALPKNVSMTATQTPFIEVIDRITNLIKWRYKIQGTCLRLEPDTPYLKNYNIQFLSMKRESTNNVSVATKLLSNDASISLNNGSDSTISSTMSLDFWEELDQNLSVLLMDESEGKKPFAVHKQTGLLSIYATESKHKVIDSYLKKLRKIASAQVLIEAKIVEVTLSDQYKSGINWDSFNLLPGIKGSLNEQGKNVGLMLTNGTTTSMSAFFNLLNQFGTTRTLSNPRLTVMNNQPAILKVVKNHVYFQLKYDTYFPHSKSTNTNGTEPFVNVQSQINTVPIGLILTLQPSIDAETGEIILALRPTISSKAGNALDPAVQITAAKVKGQNSSINLDDIKSEIPIVKVDEINSVLRMGEDMVVLGGMMKEQVRNQQDGLPGLMDSPLSGIFGRKEEEREVTELVIFLKAHKLDDEDEDTSVHDADLRLLDKFTSDPRR